MREYRENVCSTKTKPVDITTVVPKNYNSHAVLANEFCAKVENLSSKVHSDQAGRFTIESSEGDKYDMFTYYHDVSTILAHPLISKIPSDYLQAI